jgi:K+-sensing histidine kinase KdpD
MSCDGAIGRTHRKAKERGAVGSKGAAVAIRLRDLIAPMLLTVAAILLTSLLINQAHADLTALHIWHDPEDLTLAYILPTIFITALYGSNFGVSSALVGGLGAAYFVYPPQFSFAIDSTQHLVELGFLVILSVTACKSTAVITDVKPLNRGPRRS